ncbi:Poly(A)-specific ribonuclease PARN-like [Apostasia shenzhenica]|uniref:Poly(A)-specific ribonuclease PARN-like n=1 Tax=Apostasia shenzhenica TaxID=1088818 RepID=A0A2I0AVD8_9ASPA|nr:Poly(A)-specific ribonuclease PARN-like [Apostasia shenzhenica]
MAAIASGKTGCSSKVVKQVRKSNFAVTIPQLTADIEAADFVAVTIRKTGDCSSSSSYRQPWRRILPIDTREIAYLKSKHAAESFELLQFAVCPFSIHGSKVRAFPYNFHLFPRDELDIGMPSYSFSCQSSFLSSMAHEGFDFNACIHDGISYLSRVQEAKAKDRNPRSLLRPISSWANLSVADSIFKERIKSRITHWRNACRDSTQPNNCSLVHLLKKIILSGESYGSRPSLSVDVCSEKQVPLVLETVNQISDDLVASVIPEVGGQTKAVRVVLTSSEEDKKVFLAELEALEQEQNLKIRGFRQVIDLISASHKPVISHNCLHDFSFIHQKFLGPLPSTLSEFMCSLRLLFSTVVDVNHLLEEISPLRKAKNISSSHRYLKRQFFVPIELEFPHQIEDESGNHGHNVLKIITLFVELSKLLSIPTEEHANIFHPTSISLQELGDNEDDDPNFWKDVARRLSTDNVIFLWGFGGADYAAEIKRRFFQLDDEVDVQMVDKTCAVVVFKRTGSAETLLKELCSMETVSGALKEMVADGLRFAGYDAYRKICRLGLWEKDLADSFEMALAEPVEK